MGNPMNKKLESRYQLIHSILITTLWDIPHSSDYSKRINYLLAQLPDNPIT